MLWRSLGRVMIYQKGNSEERSLQNIRAPVEKKQNRALYSGYTLGSQKSCNWTKWWSKMENLMATHLSERFACSFMCSENIYSKLYMCSHRTIAARICELKKHIPCAQNGLASSWESKCKDEGLAWWSAVGGALGWKRISGAPTAHLQFPAQFSRCGGDTESFWAGQPY